jgi:hypothetical protein
MSKQPEALRLADAIDSADSNFYAESSIFFDKELAETVSSAADELRRLHAVNGELLEAARSAERLAQIVSEQNKCANRRAHLGWSAAGEDGLFGIAVKSDSDAVIWQGLEATRCQLIASIRAAITKAAAAA